MICPYCGTPFIVERAINNFQNTYNITNSTVNIYGGKSEDFVIRAGVLEKYNGSDVNVVIPNNVTDIGVRAFEKCYGLKEITFSSNIKTIQESAFAECTSLSKLVFPDSLTYIGWSAFKNCTGLREISFSKNLEVIKDYAFDGCANLKEIVFPKNLHTIGYAAFENCKNLEKVIMPHANPRIQEHLFRFCDKLTDIHFPNGQWETWRSAVWDTPFHEKILKKAEEEKRKEYGLCTYCGGEFKGLFKAVCKKCGRPKNY